MRFLVLALLAVFLPLSACAQEDGRKTLGQKAPDSPAINTATAQVDFKDEVQLAESAKFETRRAANITCQGIALQGGAVLCQTAPNAKIKVERSENDFYFENADSQGRIIIGFDRDEGENFIEAGGERVTFDLAARDYDISRIDGLPPSQVSTFSEAQLKRIRSSSARKKLGFASRETTLGFNNGFISPVKDYRKTTNFGAQRILNGEKKRPHYGVDMAAPKGTPIYAPADGVVSLADDDLYFEGAMVMLDHGQGLISMYLHTDEILVKAGQRVKQGEQIATIGSKGRSTAYSYPIDVSRHHCVKIINPRRFAPVF